jgi:hypothetical protein
MLSVFMLSAILMSVVVPLLNDAQHYGLYCDTQHKRHSESYSAYAVTFVMLNVVMLSVILLSVVASI